MPRFTLANGPLRAEIDPDLGAGLVDFSIIGPNDWHYPIMRRASSDASHFNQLACYLLAPWTNRIADARFSSLGSEFRLTPDWPDGSAIHGDVKQRRFRIRQRSPISALLSVDASDARGRNWPWPYHFAVRYELGENSLTIDASLTNLADSVMPAGLGFHPFWMRRLWDDNDEVIVSATLSGRYPAKHMIPSGPPEHDRVTRHLASVLPLGDLALDDVFAGFDGQARIEWTHSGVRLDFHCSPNLNHLVIYSPVLDQSGPLTWFCVEPVTMTNDAFNLASRGMHGTGATCIPPGKSLDARVHLRVTASEPRAVKP